MIRLLTCQWRRQALVSPKTDGELLFLFKKIAMNSCCSAVYLLCEVSL